MRFEEFIRSCKSGNLPLPEKEVQKLDQEILIERSQAFLKHLNKIRVRMCHLALAEILPPETFKEVSDRLDTIEDVFKSSELTHISLRRAVYHSNLIVEMLNSRSA